MLSDDDHDSLFGDDSQSDHEQAGLALPSLHGKTMAAAAANGECGGSRVGTSALSVSPLPVSEQPSPAAFASSGSAPLPAQSVVPGRNVPTGRTPPPSSQSHQSKNKRVAISVPEPAADGPRPNHFLRSQSNLLGVAGSVSSNLTGRRVHPPPTGASADDAIPILDDDAEPQRPKKRRRKAAHPSPNLNSPADAIRAVMQSLTTDLSVTSLLQALLEHLKSFSDPTTTKIRRVDINGREISEEEWRFLKTQDLVRKLSAALKKALKAAGGGGSNASSLAFFRESQTCSNCGSSSSGTVEMLQTVIQQWIQSKLVSQVASSPSVTPAPSTPSSLASVAPLSTLSTHSMLPSNTSDCGVGLDLTWKKTGLTSWGPRQAIPADPTSDLGTLIAPDPSLGSGSGQFDLGELESLLGLIPTLDPSPSISFQSDMASPTLDLAIDPSLPPWPDLPALAASQQWISEASAASTSYLPHSASIPPVGEITGNQDSVMLPVADVPSNPEPRSSHLFDPSLPLTVTSPGSLFSIPPSAMTPQQTDRQADDSYPAVPPHSAPQPVSNPAPPSGGQRQPGKTTKMTATLERARAHHRSLQAAMDKALTTMWELEIEHATLSKVLKGITDRQA